jgi:hypothetical protein
MKTSRVRGVLLAFALAFAPGCVSFVSDDVTFEAGSVSVTVGDRVTDPAREATQTGPVVALTIETVNGGRSSAALDAAARLAALLGKDVTSGTVDVSSGDGEE